MNHLINIEDLMEATGYKTTGRVESWLQDNHVPYLVGKKGKIITTIDKINDALDGIKTHSESIEFGYGSKS